MGGHRHRGGPGLLRRCGPADGAGATGSFAGTFWEKPTLNSFESGWEIHKPVIAAVNGHCLGYGLTLVTWCDFVLASERATFGYPEVRLGVPAMVGAVRLPQRIAWADAMELLLTGEPWTPSTPAHRARVAGGPPRHALGRGTGSGRPPGGGGAAGPAGHQGDGRPGPRPGAAGGPSLRRDHAPGGGGERRRGGGDAGRGRAPATAVGGPLRRTLRPPGTPMGLGTGTGSGPRLGAACDGPWSRLGFAPSRQDVGRRAVREWPRRGERGVRGRCDGCTGPRACCSAWPW